MGAPPHKKKLSNRKTRNKLNNPVGGNWICTMYGTSNMDEEHIKNEFGVMKGNIENKILYIYTLALHYYCGTMRDSAML